MTKCRACAQLKSSNELIDIFLPFNDDCPLQMAEVLLLCCSLNVMVNDSLPKQICRDCRQELWRAFKFRKLCQKSERTLIAREESLETTINTISHANPLEIGSHGNSNIIARKSVHDSDGFETRPIQPNQQLVEIVVEKLKDKLSLGIGNPESNSDDNNYHTEDIIATPLANMINESAIANDLGLTNNNRGLFQDKTTAWTWDGQTEFENQLKQKNIDMGFTNMYDCDICEKAFKRFSEFKEHMQIDHFCDKPYTCYECYKRYKERNSLRTHLANVHKVLLTKDYTVTQYLLESKPNNSRSITPELLKPEIIENKVKKWNVVHTCDICGKTCRFLAHMKEHMRVHSNERPYKCHLCGRYYKAVSTLRNHCRRVHNSQCTNNETLTNLLQSSEDTIQNQATQNDSDDNSSNLPISITNNTNQHFEEIVAELFKMENSIEVGTYETVHSNNQLEEPLLSASPDRATEDNANITTVEESFQNVIVENVFLQEHHEYYPSDEINHTENKKISRNTCPICGKTSKVMKEHMVSHSNERTFKCKECDKWFKHKSSVRNHLALTHGMNFKSRVTLNDYITLGKTFEGGDSSIINKKKNICELCGKGYRQKAHLREHMRKHTKETPYECKECGKFFGYSSSFQLHKKRVHGSEHLCTICNVKFPNKKLLTEHTNTVHHNVNQSSSSNRKVDIRKENTYYSLPQLV